MQSQFKAQDGGKSKGEKKTSTYFLPFFAIKCGLRTKSSQRASVIINKSKRDKRIKVMLLLTLLDFKHILKVFQCSSHVLINLHITSCNHHPHTDLIRQKSPESAKLPELSEVEKHCW